MFGPFLSYLPPLQRLSFPLQTLSLSLSFSLTNQLQCSSTNKMKFSLPALPQIRSYTSKLTGYTAFSTLFDPVISALFDYSPVKGVSNMKLFDVGWGFDAMYVLSMVGGLDEGNRILLCKTDCMAAKIKDLEEALPPALGNKRKLDNDLVSWMTKGHELVHEARSFLGPDSGETCSGKKREVKAWIMYIPKTCLKLVFVHRLIKVLSDHEKEVDMLLRQRTLPDTQGPHYDNIIPVGEMFGKAAFDAMEQLQALLLGDAIGRIAVYGLEGIGKSFLMKHLHNSVVKSAERFDYVFWVTTSDDFSIESLQDAVATAVKFDLSSADGVVKRAELLSNTLAGLGNFVLFLDNVPEVEFSLVHLGIHIVAEESKSKLVISTRSSSVPEMLNCLKTLKLEPFSDEEAWQFFVKEAKISNEAAGLGGSTDIAKLLAKECCGIPGKIVDIAGRVRCINDPCEWRNTLYECRKSQAPLYL